MAKHGNDFSIMHVSLSLLFVILLVNNLLDPFFRIVIGQTAIRVSAWV
jgi:hypothetical protein